MDALLTTQGNWELGINHGSLQDISESISKNARVGLAIEAEILVMREALKLAKADCLSDLLVEEDSYVG